MARLGRSVPLAAYHPGPSTSGPLHARARSATLPDTWHSAGSDASFRKTWDRISSSTALLMAFVSLGSLVAVQSLGPVVNARYSATATELSTGGSGGRSGAGNAGGGAGGNGNSGNNGNHGNGNNGNGNGNNGHAGS